MYIDRLLKVVVEEFEGVSNIKKEKRARRVVDVVWCGGDSGLVCESA